MPAGVSWPRYLRMFGASVLAMFAGAQAVHQYYLPDLVRNRTDLFPQSVFFCRCSGYENVLGCIEVIMIIIFRFLKSLQNPNKCATIQLDGVVYCHCYYT